MFSLALASCLEIQQCTGSRMPSFGVKLPVHISVVLRNVCYRFSSLLFQLYSGDGTKRGDSLMWLQAQLWAL